MNAGNASRWVVLRSLAARQHGLATHQQLLTVGFPRATVADLVARGQLVRVAPGVLALPGVQLTPVHRVAAAVLDHPRAAVTGWSAAWLWGLVRAAPTTVHVVVPVPLRGPRTPGTRVRRSRTLQPEDVTAVQGIAVVTVARMLADLAGDATVHALRELAIDGRQRRLLQVAELARVTAHAGRIPGIAKLRQLLAELDAGQSDSILEHTTRAGLLRAGFRPHPTPYPLTIEGTRIHLDIAFPPQRVAVEPEGLGFHSTRADLARDQARANLLARTDWKVLRVGWHDVHHDFERIVVDLTALLRSRGWQPPRSSSVVHPIPNAELDAHAIEVGS